MYVNEFNIAAADTLSYTMYMTSLVHVYCTIILVL